MPSKIELNDRYIRRSSLFNFHYLITHDETTQLYLRRFWFIFSICACVYLCDVEAFLALILAGNSLYANNILKYQNSLITFMRRNAVKRKKYVAFDTFININMIIHWLWRWRWLPTFDKRLAKIPFPLTIHKSISNFSSTHTRNCVFFLFFFFVFESNISALSLPFVRVQSVFCSISINIQSVHGLIVISWIFSFTN